MIGYRENPLFLAPVADPTEQACALSASLSQTDCEHAQPRGVRLMRSERVIGPADLGSKLGTAVWRDKLVANAKRRATLPRRGASGYLPFRRWKFFGSTQ